LYTSLFVQAARQAAARGERVLITAPSNLAVDNLVLRLAEADPALRLVRVGNSERIGVAALDLTPSAVAEARVGRCQLQY